MCLRTSVTSSAGNKDAKLTYQSARWSSAATTQPKRKSPRSPSSPAQITTRLLPAVISSFPYLAQIHDTLLLKFNHACSLCRVSSSWRMHSSLTRTHDKQSENRVDRLAVVCVCVVCSVQRIGDVEVSWLLGRHLRSWATEFSSTFC